MLTFKKGEHLTGRKNFGELVEKGTSFYVFPFRVVFILSASQAGHDDNKETKAVFCARLGISVPKRKFGSAVDRNTIKRQIREAYRKNKDILLYPYLRKKNLDCSFLLIYTHSQILDSPALELKTINVLKKLEHEFISVS